MLVRSLGLGVALEKEMATHSSMHAWRIPWTEEPGGLQSMGHRESNKTEWLTHTQHINKLNDTHGCHDSSEVNHQGPNSGRWPNSWKSLSLFPKIVGIIPPLIQFSSVQLLSHVWLFETLWTTAHQASLSITNSWSPPKPMSILSVRPSNHLILCHPLLLLPSIFPSSRVFSNESALRIRWPKYWSFSFNISPSNEHPRLIPLISLWNYPAHNSWSHQISRLLLPSNGPHSSCGVCFLSKATSYLSLSLNSLCEKTSRT